MRECPVLATQLMQLFRKWRLTRDASSSNTTPGLREKTINNYMDSIRGFFNWMVYAKLLPSESRGDGPVPRLEMLFNGPLLTCYYNHLLVEKYTFATRWEENDAMHMAIKSSHKQPPCQLHVLLFTGPSI